MYIVCKTEVVIVVYKTNSDNFKFIVDYKKIVLISHSLISIHPYSIIIIIIIIFFINSTLLIVRY